MRRLALTLLLLWIGTAAKADPNRTKIIFDNGVPNGEGGLVSDPKWWPWGDSGLIPPQFSGQQFTTDSHSYFLTGIEWSGIYFSAAAIEPSGDAAIEDNFTVTLFECVDGVPSLGSAQTLRLTSMQRVYVDADNWHNAARIEPVLLHAKSTYLISIVNDCNDLLWCWDCGGTPGAGSRGFFYRDSVDDNWTWHPNTELTIKLKGVQTTGKERQ